MGVLCIFKSLEAGTDLGLSAASVFQTGELYLREQLAFTKKIQLGGTEHPQVAIFDGDTENARVLEDRRNVPVLMLPARQRDELLGEDDEIAPLVTLEPIEDEEARRGVVVDDIDEDRGADLDYIPTRGRPKADVLRKLIYSSTNIAGVLAQLSQYRRVWVMNGNFQELNFSK